MPSPPHERLLALYAFLIGRRAAVSRQTVREGVLYYREAPSPAAFERMFERDKAALREIGVDLRTVTEAGEPRYEIPREQLQQSAEIRFEGSELLILGLAVQLWEDPDVDPGLAHTLRRLGAASEDLVELSSADLNSPEQKSVRRRPLRRTISGEGPFARLLTALSQGRAVRCDYRRRDSLEYVSRRMRPWGIGQRFGHWYVSGWDLQRQNRRTYRLSRMRELELLDQTGPETPEDFTMAAALEEIAEAPAPLAQMSWPQDWTAAVCDWFESGDGLRPQGPLADSCVCVEVADVEEAARCLAEAQGAVSLDALPPSSHLSASERSTSPNPRLSVQEAERIRQRSRELVEAAKMLAQVCRRQSSSSTPVQPAPRHRENAADRFLRLLEIIHLVDHHPGLTIREISRSLGVPPRQVERDLTAIVFAGESLWGVAELQVEAIGAEVYVRLDESLSRPLGLSAEEIVKLLLALHQWEEIIKDGDVTALKDQLLASLPRTVHSPGQLAVQVEPRLSDTAHRLQEAARSQRCVEFTYRARGQVEATPRIVMPISVQSRGTQWLLTAHSREHGQLRTYRLEAIEGLQELSADQTPRCVKEVPEGAVGEHSHPKRSADRSALVWISSDREDLRSALRARVLRPQLLEGPAAREGVLASVSIHDVARFERLIRHHGGEIALWPGLYSSGTS